MLQEVLEQKLEALGRDAGVLRSPPDIVLGGRVLDDELVLRRAPGMDAGIGQQRAAFADLRLAAADGFLVEARCPEIPEHAFEPPKAEGLGTMGAVENADILHGDPPRRSRIGSPELRRTRPEGLSSLIARMAEIRFAIYLGTRRSRGLRSRRIHGFSHPDVGACSANSESATQRNGFRFVRKIFGDSRKP